MRTQPWVVMRKGVHAAKAALRFALMAGTAIVATPATAATLAWSAGIGDWFAVSNWLAAQVPVGNDTAVINNGDTAQAGSDVAVFTLGAGSTFDPGASVSGTASFGDNLTLAGELIAGRSFSAPGATAVGTVTVTGTLATQPPQFPPSFAFWSIGVGLGGSGSGTVTAASVDTSAQALGNLLVGLASQGGAANGSLSLGSGTLDVAANVAIGAASGLAGATAQGTLSLGGTLRAEGADRFLQVGVVSGEFFDAGAGRGVGSIAAAGVEGFRFVTIGIGSAYNGAVDPISGDPLVTATGTATIGAGRIVDTATPGTLSIGVARGFPVNNSLVGPGPAVTGAASVAGDIAGYAIVDIGRVVSTGQANGSLDLTDGTLTTGVLRIGTVEGAGSNVTLTDGATDAVGRLSVTDGAIAIAVPGSLGRTDVGAMVFADPSIANRAQGTLELTRSSLTGGLLNVGVGGGDGTLTATTGSTIDVNLLSVGASGGTGTVTLQDSSLAIRADAAFATTGSAFIGGIGASGALSATRSTVAIDRNLIIADNAFGFQPRLSSVALADSTLTVGEFVRIGHFSPGNRGELSLVNSTAAVGNSLILGQAANDGALFGEAMLEVRSSLLTIGGDLFMQALAAPGLETIFGIDGLVRGLGGYGAIDAETATLAGRVTVDFAGLGAPPGIGDWVFDLIVTGTGIFRDFDSVQFLGLADGYHVSFHGIVEQSEGAVWRVILAQADPNAVPEPAALALLLFGLAGLALARRRV